MEQIVIAKLSHNLLYVYLCFAFGIASAALLRLTIPNPYKKRNFIASHRQKGDTLLRLSHEFNVKDATQSTVYMLPCRAGVVKGFLGDIFMVGFHL